jgi:hypothetical protein
MNAKIEIISRYLFPSDFEGVLLQLHKVETVILRNWKESPDRIQAAILKASGSDKAKFERNLNLAYQDWRDILVAAGFEKNVSDHERWINEMIKESKKDERNRK